MFKQILAGLMVCGFAGGSVSANVIVKIDFNIQMPDPLGGSVYIELFDDTPVTQANFLNYVNDGDFTDVIMHRSIPGFVLQGGGFTWNGSSFDAIATDPPIVNEFARSNLRGTISMATLHGDPDSATSQFFFNLVDNSANLDFQNGGFAVFARVLGNGMDLIDAFAALPTSTVAGFPDVPLLNGATLLRMTNAVVVPEPASLALLGLGGLGLHHRQGRRSRGA